jgi:hypothetical protein
LLNLAYLFDPRPGPLPAHDLQLVLALIVFFTVGLGASIFWVTKLKIRGFVRWLQLGQIPVSAVAILLLTARLANLPYLSTRVLLYGVVSLSAVLWGTSLFRWADNTGFLKRQLGLLTLSWPGMEPPTPAFAAIALAAGHVLGLTFLSASLGASYLSLAALSLLLWAPDLVFAIRVRKWTIHLEAMTPLYFAYLAAVARRVCAKLLSQPLPLYDGFSYPEPLSSFLNVEAVLFTSVLYVLLLQGYLLALRAHRIDQVTRYAAVGFAVLVFVWAGIAYFRHRTHGVTANDPYAYTQMAVDIAEHGDPTHNFPLFPMVSNLGISWWPVVHYGYQVRVPPLRGDGTTASDWPPGWPVILAAGYLLLGEQGLYLANPAVGLLVLAAVVGLVGELLHDWPAAARLAGGAFAAFSLATSYEQIDRIVVPMADASTQLFTVLTLILLLRWMRTQRRTDALLAGVCFGWAYLIRHTQLVLGLCALPALLYARSRGLKLKPQWMSVGLFGLAALLMASPDLFYHQVVFGHFWTPESTELGLFSLSSIVPAARLIFQRALSGNEFGYLLPLVVYGAYRMFRSRRGEFLVLLAAVLGILAVHLPYAALRLRDLLSTFPLVVACAGYGVADLWNRIAPRERPAAYWRYALGTSVLLATLLLPVLRTWPILARPWGTYTASFGYVTAEQRLGFEALAEGVSEPCVVGSSLNGGPIDLYAGQQSFRPAFWTSAEFDIFLGEMFRRGIDVYILDDGEDLAPNLAHARIHYQVTSKGRLTVPLFGDPQRVSSELYQIEPSEGSSS